ncbi:hypothetical protein F5Y14DRAFT_447498 [Nemania sp. NC0429]|nr:hypothetical protein F5Y14DRAFT_447498 [Nemania sp. NC0429]
MSSPTKPAKKWDDTMLAHLCVAIYDTVNASITLEDKDAIVAIMNGRFGHDTNWNAIRLMKWDSKVHEDILVAISDVLQLSRTDWEHIMSALQKMGYTFTEGALKYVIHILEDYAIAQRP